MDKITIERETLERVLECLVQEGRSLRAAEVREALAAQPAPAAVPPGYALVPIEPTREMLHAAHDVLGVPLARLRYHAMIAAAGDKP